MDKKPNNLQKLQNFSSKVEFLHLIMILPLQTQYNGLYLHKKIFDQKLALKGPKNDQ